jgi:hypothetical protein
VMVVHIGESGEAFALATVGQTIRFEPFPHQVAKGLGAVAIASQLPEFLELLNQIVVQRNGDPLHLRSRV